MGQFPNNGPRRSSAGFYAEHYKPHGASRMVVRPIMNGVSTPQIIRAKSWCYTDVTAPNANFGLNADVVHAFSNHNDSYVGGTQGKQVVINFEQQITIPKINTHVPQLFIGGFLNETTNALAKFTGAWSGGSILIQGYVRVTLITVPFVTANVTYINTPTLGAIVAEALFASAYLRLTTLSGSVTFDSSTSFIASLNRDAVFTNPISSLEYLFNLDAVNPVTCYGVLIDVAPNAVLPSPLVTPVNGSQAQLDIDMTGGVPYFVIPVR